MTPGYLKTYILQPFFLVNLLLFAGCAPGWVWQHPLGLDDQALQLAINDCERIAWEEVNRYDYFSPYPYPYFAPYHKHHFYRYPYWDYYPSGYFYDSQSRLLDQQRFFRTCMYSKGWRQVPITEPR